MIHGRRADEIRQKEVWRCAAIEFELE